jgi:NAD(P)-dependent dehydrogenase (short-subunit alcohol dehydrogenase family)
LSETWGCSKLVPGEGGNVGLGSGSRGEPAHPDLSRFSLEGKTAVITGASKNIGAALALGFARAGADLLVIARGGELLEKVADYVRRQTGRRVETLIADVSQPDAASQIVDFAGRLHLSLRQETLVARGLRVAGSHGYHDTGDLDTGDERRLPLVLVSAVRIEQLGETHPGGTHVDHHAVVGLVRLGKLDQLQAVRPVESLQLLSAHSPNLAADAIVNRERCPARVVEGGGVV